MSYAPAGVPEVLAVIRRIVGDLIGTYRRPDGSTTPALYVVGRQDVPSNWTVEGVECVLSEVPEMRTEAGVGMVNQVRTWTIRFTNYGDDAAIATIQDRFHRTFPQWVTTTYLPSSADSFEQVTVRLTERVLRNSYL